MLLYLFNIMWSSVTLINGAGSSVAGREIQNTRSVPTGETLILRASISSGGAAVLESRDCSHLTCHDCNLLYYFFLVPSQLIIKIS